MTIQPPTSRGHQQISRRRALLHNTLREHVRQVHLGRVRESTSANMARNATERTAMNIYNLDIFMPSATESFLEAPKTEPRALSTSCSDANGNGESVQMGRKLKSRHSDSQTVSRSDSQTGRRQTVRQSDSQPFSLGGDLGAHGSRTQVQ